MKKEDLSIVIAGPLDKKSLDNLNYYKSIGQVIISYWDTCQHNILFDYDLTDVKTIRRPLPHQYIIPYAKAYGTFSYQVYGIFHGLQICDTPYVIRTRSDEMFGNLQPLIEKFKQNTNKVVCGNILFKKWDMFKYHHGDHLFVGKTSILLNAYRSIIEGKTKNIINDVAEAVTAIAIMNELNVELSKDGFKNAFDVIDTNELKPFFSRFRQQGINYNNHFPRGEFNTITNIDEL